MKRKQLRLAPEGINGPVRRVLRNQEDSMSCKMDCENCEIAIAKKAQCRSQSQNNTI